jgi:deoxyribose-phosphate aldolase
MTKIDFDSLTERDIAKTIDHSLLRPELDDAFIEDGCRLAADYDVASVCVRPADVLRAAAILDGTDVAVGTTIGFPHGNHLTAVKVFEAERALEQGATELDMVIQIGALRSGRDTDVQADIAAVVEVAHEAGAIVKVIFENAYLTDDEKIRACHLSEAAGADFVKTSTGKATSGATPGVVLVMLEAIRDYVDRTGRVVGMKAAGGVSVSKAALHMLVLVKETLGDEWLTNERFRIGASSLLNDLLMQYQKTETGHYARPEDFSKE